MSRSGSKLVPLEENLVDQLHDAPPAPAHPITHHPIKFSGETTKSKIDRVRTAISTPPPSSSSALVETTLWDVQKSAYIYLLPSLPTIAWLLNFRCDGDIPYCPTTFAYVAITAEECVVFVDGDRLDAATQKDWKEAGVTVRKYGVKEVGDWITAYVSQVRAERDEKDPKRDVQILGAPECSWALSRACEPVSPLDALRVVIIS